MDGSFLTPMARLGNQDFYIYEPCMLRDGTVIMPHRWFIRPEAGRMGPRTGTGLQYDPLFAKVWRMVPIQTAGGQRGWRVLAFGDLQVDAQAMQSSFPVIKESYANYNIHNPQNIIG